MKHSIPLPRPRQPGPFSRGSPEAYRDTGASEHTITALPLFPLCTQLTMHSGHHSEPCFSLPLSASPLSSLFSLSPLNIFGAHSY